MDDENIVNDADILIVFGGDGTVLHWAKIVDKMETPILGINYGTLGFITDIEPDLEYIKFAIEAIMSNEYGIIPRMQLFGSLERKNGIGNVSFRALNEIVIRGINSRLTKLSLSINNRHIVDFAGDGIIIATPTGSTGYSLSAGGSIVHPSMEAILITPICPHSISVRPMIMPPTEEIHIKLIDGANAVIIADGGEPIELLSSDDLYVNKASCPINLIQVAGTSFYSKIKDRLQWCKGIK
jgi:NAD+ kinase